ncbi:MAG TPA: M28 family metallopeptidase, partial [Candidatus Polarisedimenticolia bacterium]|nr:M28 family metallopeptidase [Candidatus Polarisedimenticolia bacterium]
VYRKADNAGCSVILRGENGERAFGVGTDLFYQMACAQAPALEAQAVFVGYGLTAPELHYDDLKGIDLRGKIAVYLAGGPTEIPEPLRSHAQYPAERWARFREAGAVGWLSIPNLRNMDLPWERIVRNASVPSLVLADSALDERLGQRFAVTMNPERADALFEGTGHDVRELLELADSERVLPRFPLRVRIVSTARYQTRSVTADNVVGIYPGTDHAARPSYVVLSAHLDHLGIVSQAGDSILNGALDNAAGVATLLETARQLRASRVQPRRSIVFLALTGEEKGLLGSRYFAVRSPLDGGVVADLNIDMLLPIAPFDRITVFGLGESDLGELATSVAARHGLTAQPDPMPLRNRFIRSDQFNFVRTGVPSLAFTSGGLPGSPIESLRAAWLHERYHAPGDDLKQPVDRASAARFTRFFTDLALEISNRERAPEWGASSYFRRFTRHD